MANLTIHGVSVARFQVREDIEKRLPDFSKYVDPQKAWVRHGGTPIAGWFHIITIIFQTFAWWMVGAPRFGPRMANGWWTCEPRKKTQCIVYVRELYYITFAKEKCWVAKDRESNLLRERSRKRCFRYFKLFVLFSGNGPVGMDGKLTQEV